jgi:helix-turn-helix protein
MATISGSERKIADEIGKFIQTVKNGREMKNSGWIKGRIIVSNTQIVLTSNKGERKIPLKRIKNVVGRYDINQKNAGVSDYVSISFGKNVLLLSTEETEELERDLYGAILDHEYVLVKSPAVNRGVVQNTDWEKGKLKTNEDELAIAVEDCRLISVELDCISGFEATSRELRGGKKPVLEIEHTSEEDTKIETHVSAKKQVAEVCGSFVTRGLE